MKSIRNILFVVGAGVMGSACLSMQNQTTLEGIQGAAGPYVEAYIEYPGPSDKWAGPSHFILHVLAKDSGMAQIAVTPALFKPVAVDPHAPGAKAIGAVTELTRTPGMSGEAAREQLGRLMTALTGGEASFRGCLSPVRVRVIRADGAVTERHGCRGGKGWSKAVSESVDQFINKSLYGTQITTPPPKIAEKTGH